jgi:hypothetical protein
MVRGSRAATFGVAACLALGLPQAVAAEPPSATVPPEGAAGAVAAGHTSPSAAASSPRSRSQLSARTPPAGAKRARAAPSMSARTTALTGPPSVTTDGVHPTSSATATIDGNADPHGEPTRLRAEYALASARWCTSQGANGKHLKTAWQKLGNANAMISEITVTLNGLAADSDYCVELVARNRSGTSTGGLLRFATPAQAQQASGPSASGIAPATPSNGSGGWPTAAVITVASLGIVLLAGALLVAVPKLRPGARRRARPASN